ncbi:EAL domain-containing protein [Bacillus tianshenii]|nr:EAL domain-containing protein [Bacillus tianshenii]
MKNSWKPLKKKERTIKQQHLVSVFNHIEEGTIILDKEKRVIVTNPMALALAGYEHDELLKLSFDDLFEHTDECIWGMHQGNSRWKGEVQLKKKSGKVISCWLLLREIHDSDGKLINYLVAFRDMTDKKRSQSQLRLAEKIIENTSEGVMVTDKQGNILFVNPAFETVTGFLSEEVIGKTPKILQSGVHSESFYAQMWEQINEKGSWTGELWNCRKDGKLYTEWANISSLRDERGEVTNYVAVFSDITERKKAEERLRYLAHYDMLTGVANRYLYNKRLKKYIEAAQKNEHQLAVLFLDLDRFKLINDTLGHGIGDLLLKGVAKRLQACLGEETFIARLGGDEFTIVLPEIHHSNAARTAANLVIDSLEKPFLLKGHEVYTSPSIGISIYPNDGESADELVKHADVAMYEAKIRGRNNYAFYSHHLSAPRIEEVQLENHLRKALEREEFSINFQPQICIKTGEIAGMECLLRWYHPSLGFVSPESFVPLAEETGLIMSISYWAIKEACKQAKEVHDKGYAIRLGVNISAIQFQQEDFVENIHRILSETSLDPRCFEIELTETMIMPMASRAVDKLVQLKRLGVKIAIDDFGTGYSSLSYLGRLPIDTIKIDKSFIRNLLNYHEDASIVRAIITMAHSLQMHVVAEGVEQQKQLEFLKDEKCDMIQGYYISRPINYKDLREFLSEWEPQYISQEQEI